MERRIENGGAKDEEVTVAASEDIEAHLRALRQFAKIANQAMCAMMALELRIRRSIDELEIAHQQAVCTDLLRTKELLTLSEAASMLAVSVARLRNDGGRRYPSPHPARGRSLL